MAIDYKKLPVYLQKDKILEVLEKNQVIVVQSPTGSGKTYLAQTLFDDIPAEEMDKAMELHKALVEAAAENDESLMEKFFEEESLTEDELREGIRKGLVTRSIFPVFCVCAGKDMGIRRLMEFLGNVVPFVSEMPKIHNTRGEEVAADSTAPTSLYFFK